MKNKKILIFGENSYIGTQFQNYIKDNQNYEIDVIKSRGEDWKREDFSIYDVIFFVAGIAHVSKNNKMEKLYYEINRDLPIQVAQKAKKEKVKQFIFMSSIIIYGPDGKIGEKKAINRETEKNPIDFYGKSKLEADETLQKMESNEFKIVIVRAPMIYGPNCKGNFPKLKKIARISLIFPNIQNERSMLYIENLCEFLKKMIENEKTGVFYPQNKEYMSTKEIIEVLSEKQGKKIHFIQIFNPILKLLSKRINFINKIFGNKTYEKELSQPFDYIVVENRESIRRSA